MTETSVTRTTRNKRVGNGQVQQEVVSTEELVDSQDYFLVKMSQFLWYITHIVTLILTLRFVFLLLGANLTGIVLFIYNMSELLVRPFRGIFPAARTGEFYFDPAALLAIFMYYLLTFLIVKGLELLSNNLDQQLT